MDKKRFDVEIAELVQKYLKEVKNEDLTIEEILSCPRWKRVWCWWKALEHYEGKPRPQLSFDEVKSIYGE